MEMDLNHLVTFFFPTRFFACFLLAVFYLR
jgi:hypothetical protein